jgi:hypothetical protein
MAIKEKFKGIGAWKSQFLLEEKGENKDKKIRDEEEKEGLSIIKKLQSNLKKFQKFADNEILKYKKFWDENQEISSEFDSEGSIYKLWDTDYIAGVLQLPDEALSDEELEAEIEAVDSEKEGEDEDLEDDKDDGSEEEEKEDDEEELEEGNAFSGAVKKAKDAGKKDFKFKGKKYPVKESWRPEGEEFPLYEEDEEEEFPGFDPDSFGEENKKEGGDESDIEVLDGEAIEAEDDLSIDSEDSFGDDMEIEDTEGFGDTEDIEGDDLDFHSGEETSEYFVLYNMGGSEREEIFRTDSPKVIKDFIDFFENEWKADVKSQIQAFKQAQEEKKEKAEVEAKEKIRKERKSKLDQFMKESESISAYDRLKALHPDWNWAEAENEIEEDDLKAAADAYDRRHGIEESFDEDPYDEDFVLDSDDYEDDYESYDEWEAEEDYQEPDDEDFDAWVDDLVSVLMNNYDLDESEARELLEEHDLSEAYESGIDIEDAAEGIYNLE